MHAVKVDKQKRVRLKKCTPGDYYQADYSDPKAITLRRIETPKSKAKLTSEEVRRAIKNSPLKMKHSWEKLREMTREA